MNGRAAAALLLLGLTQCIVESPLAERIDTNEGLLATRIASFCASFCERMRSCFDDRCACPGASGSAGSAPLGNCVCEAYSSESCADDCRDALDAFSGRGEACAQAGLDLISCLGEARTCGDLDAAECETEAAGVPACVAGPVECRDGSSGGGFAPGTSESFCELYLDDCSDGAHYAIACSGDSSSALCTCERNGRIQSDFPWSASDCELTDAEINANCGWSVSR